MRRRRALRAAATLAFAAAGVVLLWPTGAGAVAPQAQGWWYRPQQSGTPVTVPAPPVVPSDGLYVAQGPNSENLAIAALEYPTEGGRDAALTLAFAPGGAGTVAITACPASSGFVAGAAAGPWAEAPAYNCTSAAVDGKVAEDGATVSFALTPDFLANGGAVMDVVLIPTPGSAPFQAPVVKPDGASFAPSLGPAPVEPAPGGDTSPAASDSFASSDSLASVPFPSPSGGPADFGTTPAVSPSVAAPAGGRQTAPSVRVAPLAHDRYPLSDRLGAVTLLLLTGAALWLMAGRPAPRLPFLPAPSTESEPVGGIGRFARPRTSAPNRL
jgi:hypothetical protein